MTATHPDGLDTLLTLEPLEPLELLAHLREAWTSSRLGPPTDVLAFDTDSSAGAGWAAAARAVRDHRGKNIRGTRIQIAHTATAQLIRADVPGEPPEASLTFGVSLGGVEEGATRLAVGLEVVERLARSGCVRSGTAYRLGGHARAAPSPPCSPALAHAQIVSTGEVAEHYGDTNVLERHGWTVESIPHGRLLCTRARDAFLDRDFVARTFEHQRALARLAPPRSTSYVGLETSDETRDIYESGPPRLIVSRIAGTADLLATAVLEPPQHVQGWEIDCIGDWVRRGRGDDGLKVERVSVVFPDESTAAREKRPLLDVGASVYWLRADGELEPMRE